MHSLQPFSVIHIIIDRRLSLSLNICQIQKSNYPPAASERYKEALRSLLTNNFQIILFILRVLVLSNSNYLF
jgi:hypothetical protein